jgi:phage baseplate assembly protein W
MPIPQVKRINPLDLQKNTAIGVSLPFKSPSVFKSTYSTQEQIKSNIINVLLTNRGERIMNPEFGADIKYALFESIDNNIIPLIRDKITSAFNIYIPQATINNIDIKFTEDSNLITISVQYTINISGTPDQINIEFQ